MWLLWALVYLLTPQKKEPKIVGKVPPESRYITTDPFEHEREQVEYKETGNE